MPELPEVETVLRGLAPHITGRRLAGARVGDPRLRWPVPEGLDERLRGRDIRSCRRRAKYLLLELDEETLILHLGMSGSLRLLTHPPPPDRHDHVDLLLEGGACLRLRDPRRFGAVLLAADPRHHPLLVGLGVEPLSDTFNGDWLHAASRGRKAPAKAFLMDARQVVGIGNIYANEALFQAGIDPRTAIGRLSRARCLALADTIKDVLHRAIAAGGSTLRDFVDSQGEPGYFQQTYQVYGRTSQPCRCCGTPIRSLRQSGRGTFYCPACQRR